MKDRCGIKPYWIQIYNVLMVITLTNGLTIKVKNEHMTFLEKNNLNLNNKENKINRITIIITMGRM